MAENSNYKAQTERRVPDQLPSLGNTGPYKAVSNALGEAERVTQAGLKITLSEIGFWRQVVQFGRKANSPGMNRTDPDSNIEALNNANNDYVATENIIYRQDPQYEYVFRCGNYFLPISMWYDVSASKNVVDSQLVDGPNIYEMINKKPKEVRVHLRIERSNNKLDNSGSSRNMAFMATDAAYNERSIGEVSPYAAEVNYIEYQVAELSAVLKELYEEKDVFEIEQKTLNNEVGLRWVYMDKYDLTTNQGSTIIDLEMTLKEVNMMENAIIFGESTIITNRSAGGGE